MKLSRTILYMVLAGPAAFVAAACSTDVLMDNSGRENRQEQTPYAIEFSESLINSSVRATRSGLSGLSDHMTTMGVWGWRSTLDGQIVNETQFRNKQVQFKDSVWKYTPKKYWIKDSNYRFYAYAPYTQTASIDSLTGLISINGVRLSGDNLMKDVPSASLSNNFHDSSDIDWMVARGGQTAFGSVMAQVEFTMQHILSKINVSIRFTKGFKDENFDLVIDSLKIGPLTSGGSFRQIYESNTIGDEPEWTPDNTQSDITLYSAKNTSVDTIKTYILESLVIPQEIEKSKTVKLYYSYNYSDGRKECSAYVLELGKAFGARLKSGYSYDLNLIFEPGRITFDASVSDWATMFDTNSYLNRP